MTSDVPVNDIVWIKFEKSSLWWFPLCEILKGRYVADFVLEFKNDETNKIEKTEFATKEEFRTRIFQEINTPHLGKIQDFEIQKAGEYPSNRIEELKKIYNYIER